MWSRPYTLAAKSDCVWQEETKELGEKMENKINIFFLGHVMT